MHMFILIFYTALGVCHGRLPASGFAATLEVAFWLSGAYMLLVDTEVGIVTKRLIVK